jgi:hypothetical protein
MIKKLYMYNFYITSDNPPHKWLRKMGKFPSLGGLAVIA